MTAEYIAAIETALLARGGRWTTSGGIEFRCLTAERHAYGDATPSAWWSPEKRCWSCRACGAKGGALDAGERLGVPRPQAQRETGRWAIRNAASVVEAVHVRLEPGRRGSAKDFVWEGADGRTGLGGRKTCDLPLYGIDEVGQAPPGSTVVVVEGEKARDALAARGICSVSTVTGAGGTPSDRVLGALLGHDVVLWPDHDPDGVQHMRRIAGCFAALGQPPRWLVWSEAPPKGDAADFGGTTEALRALIAGAVAMPAPPLPSSPEDPDGRRAHARVVAAPAEREPGADDDEPTRPRRRPPWDRALSAAGFLAEVDPALDWLEPRLLAPGSIAEWFSPRGLGKTQVALAIAVKLAGRGHRVLLLDRDNSRREVRRRLRAWGAADAVTLDVMTRDDVPHLLQRDKWKAFPFGDYELVIIDSLDAASEGVGEQDSSRPSLALVPLLDLAHRADGPAILVLGNTIKSGTHGRASGVVEDRADIVYEVRDATDLCPVPGGAWWNDLPSAGRDAWGERAARRQRRDRYRLAFVPSKFRIGEEPAPFIYELNLSSEPWSLRDVTAEVVAAGQAAAEEEARQADARVALARDHLRADIDRRAQAGAPTYRKEQAAAILMQSKLTRMQARAVVAQGDGTHWRLERLEEEKGRPFVLRSVNHADPRRKSPDAQAHVPHGVQTGLFTPSAPRADGVNTPPGNPCAAGGSEQRDLRRRRERITSPTMGAEDTRHLAHTPKLPAPGRYDEAPGDLADTPEFSPGPATLTVADVLDIFVGAEIVREAHRAEESPAPDDPLLQLAATKGYPVVPLRPGLTIVGTPLAWQEFAANGAPVDRAAAQTYLEEFTSLDPPNTDGWIPAPGAWPSTRAARPRNGDR
jgi:hypothetical protein